MLADEHPSLVFEAGSVRIAGRWRATREGNGLTVDVFAPNDTGDARLLRFDCLEKTPHYHLGAGTSMKILRIDCGGGIPGAIDWVMGQLETRLPALLKGLGLESVASKIDGAALAAGVDDLHRHAHRWQTNV